MLTAICKVTDFVRPYNQDGRQFILSSARELSVDAQTVKLKYKNLTGPLRKQLRSPSPPSSKSFRSPYVHLEQPKTFNHYVMNLPASAITFLDAFIGLYRGQEELFHPHTLAKMPMIHVYYFSTKNDDNTNEKRNICKEISERLRFEIRPYDHEVEVWDVRDVAPQKRMFCVSFRLPAEVAFAPVDSGW